MTFRRRTVWCVCAALLAVTAGCARDRLEAPAASDSGGAVVAEDAAGAPEDAEVEDSGDPVADASEVEDAAEDTAEPGDDARKGDAGFDAERLDTTTEDVAQEDAACDGRGVELCDGVDDDCDGVVDEGVLNGCGGCAELVGEPGEPCGACGVWRCEGQEEASCEEAPGGEPGLYWLDADMDDYGEGEPRQLCGPTGAWSAREGGDCADDDARINPGRAEVCDRLDNDCDPDTTEAEVCRIMVLGAGEEVWEGFDLDPTGDSEHAPDGDAVRAAFVVAEAQEAWVLTQWRWHRASLTDGVWVDSGGQGQHFGSLQFGVLRAAWAVAPREEGEATVVTLLVGQNAHVYTWDAEGEGFDFERIQGLDWEGPRAPRTADIQAAWLELEHTQGWYDDINLAGRCPQAPPGPPTVVGVVLAEERLHVYDAGYCFEFVEEEASRSFAPFALDSAPNPEEVRAAFWHNGLVVFR